ncbi:MAG: hypothetical protein ACK5Z2_06085 [Bacteroidota bacterium]|jgi:hypothetical protein
MSNAVHENSHSSDETDKLKIMYANLYDELNRGRDWPLKAFGISLGIETLIISGLLSSNQQSSNDYNPFNIIAFIGILIIAIYTSLIIWRQHKNYIEYRRIQRRIQFKMNLHKIKINGSSLFPESWTNPNNNVTVKGINLGVGYYLTLLWVVSIISMSICLSLYLN